MHKEKTTDKRRGGRPRRGEEHQFPTEEIDKLLVYGEVTIDQEGMPGNTSYPSYREIAKRFDISLGMVHEYSRKHCCLRRREEVAKQQIAQEQDQITEQQAHQLTYGREDVVRTIDKYLAKFEAELDAGRVRMNDPASYSAMLRLRGQILGDEGQKREICPGLTLEDLERAHQEHLDRAPLDPRLTGEVQPTRLEEDWEEEEEEDEETIN